MSAPPLLSTLPEWQDLTPLELPEDSHAAVDIQYNDEYKDAFGLLYAAMRRGEKSVRVLELTERCIYLCPAHYTVWDYRFQCLEALDADMEQEWNVCMAMAEANAKSYQIWNHRRRCALRMGLTNVPRELEFAELFLRRDAKNYHIWAHRQALVAYAGLWDQELAFCEQLLQEDVRNNSAWNQRAFITRHNLASVLMSRPSEASEKGRTACATSLKAVLLREAAYAHDALLRVPHNENAWNYMLGLVHVLGGAISDALAPHRGSLGTDASRPTDAAVAEPDRSQPQQQHTTAGAPRPAAASACVPGEDAAAAQVPAGLEHALSDAECAVHDAVFRSALAVLERLPQCVPARDALMQQYLRAAVRLYAAGDRAAAVKADKAAVQLAKGLVEASPVHAGWYHAVGQEAERRARVC